MRQPKDNPFTPGSDTIPPIWAGRSEQLQDFEDIVRPRRLNGIAERGRTILGEPGLGKSTLVRRIAQIAESEGDWVTPQLRIPQGTDPMKAISKAVLALADKAGLSASRDRRLGDLLTRVQQVAVTGVSLSLRGNEGPEPHSALTELLIAVGEEAIRDQKLVIVHIDEVQNITDSQILSQLLISLGDAIVYETDTKIPGNLMLRQALPIAIYLTGLPDFADSTKTRRGATFARRFETSVLEPIDDSDFLLALRPLVIRGWTTTDNEGNPSSVRLTDSAAQKIVDVCRGEPFLFQLAGARAWYAGTADIIDVDDVEAGWRAAEPEATAHVERSLDRLPAREKQMLEVMAKLDPADRTLTRIAKEMGYKNSSDAGPTAQRLDTTRGIISRGKPYQFRHRAIEAYLTSDWPAI